MGKKLEKAQQTQNKKIENKNVNNSRILWNKSEPSRTQKIKHFL